MKIRKGRGPAGDSSTTLLLLSSLGMEVTPSPQGRGHNRLDDE